MGYLIGGRVVNTDTYGKGKKANIIKVPNFKPVQGAPLSRTQDFQARIRSQAADISRTAPTFNDPRYTFTTLSIPTDLRTLNGLYRFFDDTDPIVGNAIRLHTEFPLAGYAFSDCGDSGIKAHYEEMWDRLHGDQLLFDLGLEYWRIGNVFLFGAWNEVDFMWDQFAILNPDYVTVDTTWLNDKPLIKLQPDEALKRIVSTGQPKFLYEQLSPEIIKYVRLGREIPLDPNNTFFIAHNKAPYEALGKSIIKRLLKMLIYEDRLNMANFAIATRQVIPITVVKLGDPASGWIPEDQEIEDVKEMFASREIDPNFTIFYHYGIDVQFYGAVGKLWNMAPEHDRVRKLKFLGLGISEAMLSGGTATYATAYMNLEVLRQRYLHFQLRLENFIHKGLFEPVAKMCGFYKTNRATVGKSYRGKVWGDARAMKHELEKRYAAKTLRDMKDNLEFQEFIKRKAQETAEFGLVVKPKYIYPRMKWDLLSLISDVQYRNFLMAFDKMFPGIRKVSDSTYYRVLRLEGESEQRQIEIENAERRELQLREARKDKVFKDKLLAEGLELPAPPPGKKPPPGAPPGGISAPSPAAPPAPGTPGAPKAPVGKKPAEGEGKPGEAKPGGGPEVLREESVKIQQELGQGLKKELSSEVKQLKKSNERMLKERDIESNKTD